MLNEIAKNIGAKSDEIVMTAGATESINLAFSAASKENGDEILVGEFEHHAVLNSAEKYGVRKLIKIKKDNIIIAGKAIVNPNFNNVSAISFEYNEIEIQGNNKITKEEAINAVKNSLKEEGKEGIIIENKIKEKIHSSSILNKAYNVIEVPVMMEHYRKMMEGKIDKMPEYSRLYEVDIETGKIIDMVGVQ